MLRLHSLYEQYALRGANDVDQGLMPSGEQIDHIIRKHHAYLMQELPELGKLVTNVFRVHGEGHPELGEFCRLYGQMKTELEGHLREEEDKLFPLIRLSALPAGRK